MKRIYKREKLTVFWDSDKCIKAGKCDGILPEVFDPKKRPWVNLNAADIDVIARVIDLCPVGALTYQTEAESKSDILTIQIFKNGPYRISGKCKLIDINEVRIDAGDNFGLCRCGLSKKMPFCDGSHFHRFHADKKTGDIIDIV